MGKVFNKRWIYDKVFFDDFNGTELDTNKWEIFGEEYGSVVVENGELIITQNGSGRAGEFLIGIVSKQYFPVGTRFRVRSKATQGRHSALIGFGAPHYPNYPHGSNVPALTWYARADNVTSVISMRNENGNTSSNAPSGHNDLREYQIFEFYRESATSVRIYRNDIEISHNLNTIFHDEYQFYFSLDGWSNSGVQIKVDWVEII